jgi:16S rRNA C1402 (ribose-2'-O) methylase RsmI
VRGEIVVVVEGNPGEAEDPGEAAESARAMAEALLAQGMAPSSVAKELRQRLHLPRNEAYQLVQELAGR